MQQNKKSKPIRKPPIQEDFQAPDRITQNIYLGSIQSSHNKKFLTQNNITHILFCIKNKMIPFPNQFIYQKIPINDFVDANIRVFFQQAYQFIENALNDNKNVLVHCIAGISRSATILASYLMRKRGIGHLEAIGFLREKRAIVNPNEGFIKQLQDYENYLQEQRSTEQK